MQRTAVVWAIEPITFGKIQAALEDATNGLSAEDRRAFFDLMEEESTKPPGRPFELRNGTAIVSLKGVLTKSGPDFWDWFMGIDGTSTANARGALRAAVADPAVQSILLLIDSPGGTVAGIDDLADDVLAARAVKPVWAYAEDLAASAAYWVGAQASRFYGNAGAEVGSIGVYAALADFSRAAEAQGIKVNVVKSAPRKGLGVAGAPITDADLEEVQRLVDQTAERFVEAVARGRGMRAKYDRDAKDRKPVPDDGKVYQSKDAVEMGLLDGIRSLDEVLAELASVGARNSNQTTTSPIPASNAKEKRMSKLAAFLGLAEDASEDEILRALEARDNAPKAEVAEAAPEPAEEKPEETAPEPEPAPAGTSATVVATAQAEAVRVGVDALIAAEVERRVAAAQRAARVNALLESLEKSGRLIPAQRCGIVDGVEIDPARVLAEANPGAFEIVMRESGMVAPVARVVPQAGLEDAGAPSAGSFAGKDIADPDLADKLDKAARAYAKAHNVSYQEASKALLRPRAA